MHAIVGSNALTLSHHHCGVRSDVRKEVIDMSNQSERTPVVTISAPQSDERVVLLEEVNFKWLLAGLGWWIDMSRFHRDIPYAKHFFELAEASNSSALRDCAASLQSYNEMACQ
jgi:hypothetical protein